MALSTLLRNKVCSQGCLWNIHLRKQLPVISNVMLHLHTRQSILKPKSIEALEKHSVKTLRNFSTTKPLAAGKHHASLWAFERVLSVTLLGLIPSIFYIDSEELETIMAACVTLHAYLGMDAILTDYARTKGAGPSIVVKLISILLAVVILAGLLNIIHNDVGLAEVLRFMWKLDKEEDKDNPR